MLNYKEWLQEKLLRILAENENFANFKIEVYNEQDYTKNIVLTPYLIIVVIKKLTSSKVFNATVQPIQITIMSEENGLMIADTIFRIFAKENNYIWTADGDKRIKHEYSDPSILKNFIPTGNGYRSLMYISASLTILEHVADIDEGSLKIDGEPVKYIRVDTGYTATLDTQPMGGQLFPTSVLQFATTAFTITVPPIENNLLLKCLQIESGALNGSTKFDVEFSIMGVPFKQKRFMVLLNTSHDPIGVPSYRMGFAL